MYVHTLDTGTYVREGHGPMSVLAYNVLLSSSVPLCSQKYTEEMSVGRAPKLQRSITQYTIPSLSQRYGFGGNTMISQIQFLLVVCILVCREVLGLW